MKRGVSIATLTATITIILILITTVTISANNMFNNVKISNFATEISLIQKSVDSYLLKNENDYPILDSVIIDLNNVSTQSRSQFSNNGENVTDNKVGLFNIDYDKIGYTDLKYGNKKNGANDIYVLSGLTGKVYYAAGFKVGDKVYYTLTDELSKSIEYKTIDSVSDEGNKVISYTQENIDDSQKKVKIKVPVNYMVTSITAGDYNYTSTTVDGYNVYEVICNAGTLIDIAYTHNGQTKSTSYTVKASDEKTQDGYVKDGMILHYDGINNTGNGHSNITTVWKDLSGNGNDGTLRNFGSTKTSGWNNDYLFLDGIDDFVNVYMPINGKNCTIEITAEYISGVYMLRSDAGFRSYIYNTHAMKGNPNAVTINFNSVNNLISTRTLRYYTQNSISKVNAYYNGVGSKEAVFEDINDGTYLAIGSYFPGYASQVSSEKVYSVRIYDRALTEDEIKQNYNVDKSRFGI